MVVILLAMLSVVALFSSTSLDGDILSGRKTRVDIFRTQVGFVVGGFIIMCLIYRFTPVSWLRKMSQCGWAVSMFLLLCLLLRVGAKEGGILPGLSGIIQAQNINHAWRTLLIFGHVQLHVFEVTKVAMVLYLAWAVECYHTHSFALANKLSARVSWLSWLAKPFWQGIVYIFIPIVTACVGLISGSISTVLFVGLIMFTTLFVGGYEFKYILLYGGILILCGLGGLGLYKVMPEGSGAQKALGKIYSRVDTGSSRLDKFSESGTYSLAERIRGEKDAQQRREIIDENTQREGALLAIKEGGILGKGPGRSTQKYRVPLMFGDYMYSFLIEEYGLIMGIFVLILYVCLLARGSRIAMLCKKTFYRTAVAGLSLLISGQAMMHILINVGLMPITGQTLPIVSDGKSSLLMFYYAFAVLLIISKTAKKQMEKEIKLAAAQ